MSADVVVERRREADAEDLFRMYQEVFGAALTDSSRRRWRWQYLQNPVRDPEGPQIWVAREGDTPLGQYASMPVRLWWDGREVRSSWGMDVFLHEQARGKGIGARLFTTWSDHEEVALGLGLTESSYGLFKKLRYADVGPVPFFQKVLDPGPVLRRRLGTAAGVLLTAPARLGLAVARRPHLHPSAEVVVRRVPSFAGGADALWERARAGYGMCVRRDDAYLSWKYEQVPGRAYELWEARAGAELRGIAVSRDEDYHGVRLGWIVDLFAAADDDGARDALLEAVVARFRERQVARAQAFAMHDALQQSLRRAGFWSAASPMQFCVRSRVGGDALFAQRGRWHVVFGDSDMDR